MSNDKAKKSFSEYIIEKAILIGIAIGLLCLFACAILALWISSDLEDRSITWLVQLAGMAAGGFFGFLASPKAPREEAAFLTVAKAISAFLSGYALSKIDHFIDIVFQGTTWKEKLLVARLLIFFISLIISVMIGYSFRAYLQESQPHDVSIKNPLKEVNDAAGKVNTNSG
jgi:hypothetical protein